MAVKFTSLIEAECLRNHPLDCPGTHQKTAVKQLPVLTLRQHARRAQFCSLVFSVEHSSVTIRSRLLVSSTITLTVSETVDLFCHLKKIESLVFNLLAGKFFLGYTAQESLSKLPEVIHNSIFHVMFVFNVFKDTLFFSLKS